MTNVDNERGRIQVISRAAAILRCLESEPDGLSLGAIAKRIELPRSTVQRLVDALAQEQLLEIQGTAGVRLGPALMRLATHSHVDVTQRVRPYLEELSRRTGETAALASATGVELTLLHCVVSTQELRVAPVANTFLTIHATSGGKVLLAGLTDGEVEKLLPSRLKMITPHTFSTRTSLLQDLAQVRRTGFAYDREEHVLGVGAIATGVQTVHGRYALSIVGPASRINAAQAHIEATLADVRDFLQSMLSAAGA